MDPPPCLPLSLSLYTVHKSECLGSWACLLYSLKFSQIGAHAVMKYFSHEISSLYRWLEAWQSSKIFFFEQDLANLRDIYPSKILGYIVSPATCMFTCMFSTWYNLSPECSPFPPTTDINNVSSWHQSLLSLFSHQTELMTSLQRGRPDHANFRILLWKCVAGFNSEFSESRSRILVPLLLRFIQLVNSKTSL